MFDPIEPFDEKETLRVFHVELMPIFSKHGSEIGERAMRGDCLAEQIIRRYHIFASWLDPYNLKLLMRVTKQWLEKRKLQ